MPPVERSLTPNELAPIMRMSADRIRAMIQRGELRGVNTPARNGKPRYVVAPADLAAWWQRNTAARPAPAPMPRRKRQAPGERDYYAETFGGA
jgi:hypothetical protein